MTPELSEPSCATGPVPEQAPTRRFSPRRVLPRLALILAIALAPLPPLWMAGCLEVARDEESTFRFDGMDCHLYDCRLVLDVRGPEITLLAWEHWDHHG